MTSSTDRIERSILINAAPSRVWKALTNAEEFGGWFGVALKGKSFTAGQPVQGHITIAGYEHVLFDVLIERVEPETLFSYRWHPYAVDPAADYSKEPTTLVEFTLKPSASGLSQEQRLAIQSKQGWAPFGVEMRIVDDENKELPWDGKRFGRLKVRGFAVVDRYFKDETEILDEDGFFDTGDVAT